MITAIRYNTFKSLVDAVLPLEPLTILIGTNASGKTNTLEGLIVLASLATKAEISQTLSAGDIRGDANSCTPFGKNKFSLGCDFESPLTGSEYPPFCRYEIEIENYDIPLISSEQLRFYKKSDNDGEIFRNPPIYATKSPPHTQIHSIEAQVDNFAKGGVKPGYSFNARIPILFDLLTTIAPDFEKRKYQQSATAIDHHKKITSDLLTSFSSILVVDPKPDAIRDSGYVSKKTDRMDKNGCHLSGVLYNLLQDSDKKDAIETVLRELPEHQIIKLDFEETSRDEVLLVVQERFEDESRKVPLKLLSDGTVRLLAVLASAFSIPEGGLMVIEEVDNSLHPSKVERLLQLLEDIARNNNIRLLVTSHNPTLMDAVKPENLRNVVLCYRETETGYSKLIRVTDIPNCPELLANDSLGSVVSKRVLEKNLKKTMKDRYDERQRKLKLWKERMGA